MKWVIALTLIGLAAASAQGAAPPKKKTNHASPASVENTKAGKSSSVHVRGVAGSKSSRRALAASNAASRRGRGRYARAGRVKRSAPVPSYQTHPDPERYQEIQKGLAARGYFKGEANGEWNSDSVDALKAFQADQKLDIDGKINARSLLGLGLGPKREGGAAAAEAIPPPPPVGTPPPP